MFSFFQAKQKNTLNKDIFENSIIIDVRSKEEFQTDPVKPAEIKVTNIPVDQIISLRTIPNTSQDSKIVLFCKSGSRSAMASEILKHGGYTNIINAGSKDNVEKILQE